MMKLEVKNRFTGAVQFVAEICAILSDAAALLSLGLFIACVAVWASVLGG